MKSTYLVAGVSVVAVIGIVAWLTSGSNLVSVTDLVETPEENLATTSTDTLSGKNSFIHLMSLGRTLECSFQFKDTATSSEGTGFFDGQKMRIDSMYRGTDGTTYTSNMIIDGTDMYVWATTEAGTFAMKMPVPVADSTLATKPNSEQLNPQDSVNYNCKSWKVDGSVFVPPSGLTFMNMADMMKGIPVVTTPPDSKVQSYTLADVEKVTYINVDPIKAAIDDEYTLYTIRLKSGATYSAHVSGMMPREMIQAALEQTGFMGDSNALMKLAVAA